MPNRSRVYQKPTKRRGRKKLQKRIPPVTVHRGYKKAIIPKPKDIDDEYASITAQTATNLKAFRQLFGSHEETDEEFLGYFTKEITSIQSTCKKKSRKISKEISYLQSTLITSTGGNGSLLPTSSHSIPPKPKKAQPHETTSYCFHMKDSALPVAENFLGFSDTDSLKDKCRDKAIKLFDTCKVLDMELLSDPSLLRISSVINETKLLELNGYVESIPKKSVIVGRKLKASTSTVTSGSTNNNNLTSESVNTTWSIETQCSPNKLKEFVQTQAIAGEITVTPILQGEVPLAVKVRCDSPILVNCLRKT